MQKLKKMRMLFICIFAFLFISSAALSVHSLFIKKVEPAKEAFNASAAFEKLDMNSGISSFLTIEQSLGSTMKEYGTKAGFELIDEGEKRGYISNDECHELLHYVGHAAYAEQPNDYDALLSVVQGTNCIGGYLHGIEAEIVIESPNVIADVEKFCVYQKEHGVNPGPCFHGVGHAGAELYKYDVRKALSLCDSLTGGPEDDLSNCYRGVFSQVGNGIVGFDGHTGLSAESVSIPGLDPKKPFNFCNTFDKKYQSSCKSQLMKLFLVGDPNSWLITCLDKTLDPQSMDICVNIAAGVFVRSTLSFADTTKLPETVNQFGIEAQKVAILGSAEAFSGYFHDDNKTKKDWQKFCQDSFKNDAVKKYCLDTLEATFAGNAPWMERTDIR